MQENDNLDELVSQLDKDIDKLMVELRELGQSLSEIRANYAAFEKVIEELFKND